MTAENTKITCPDCRGALERIQDGSMVQYRCRVGHAYSAQSAVAGHAITEENTLWAAVVAVEEAADLFDDVANQLGGETGEQLKQRAQERRKIGEHVRDLLKDLHAPQLP